MDQEAIHTYIEKYLHDKLDEGEKKAFEAQVEADTDLKESLRQQVLLHVAEWEGSQADYRNKLDSWLDKEKATPRSIWGNISSRKILLVAASILIFVTLGWLLLKPELSDPNPLDIYAEYAIPLDKKSTRTTLEDDSLNQIWRQVTESYDRGNFVQAGLITEKLLKTLPASQNQSRYRLLLGTAYLFSDRPLEALKQFEKVDSFTTFQDNADWYQGMAYLKLGILDSAQFSLHKCASEAGHLRKEEAKAVLKKLRD